MIKVGIAMVVPRMKHITGGSVTIGSDNTTVASGAAVDGRVMMVSQWVELRIGVITAAWLPRMRTCPNVAMPTKTTTSATRVDATKISWRIKSVCPSQRTILNAGRFINSVTPRVVMMSARVHVEGSLRFS